MSHGMGSSPVRKTLKPIRPRVKSAQSRIMKAMKHWNDGKPGILPARKKNEKEIIRDIRRKRLNDIIEQSWACVMKRTITRVPEPQRDRPTSSSSLQLQASPSPSKRPIPNQSSLPTKTRRFQAYGDELGLKQAYRESMVTPKIICNNGRKLFDTMANDLLISGSTEEQFPPWPERRISEEDDPSDCYIVSDNEGPPIVYEISSDSSECSRDLSPPRQLSPSSPTSSEEGCLHIDESPENDKETSIPKKQLKRTSIIPKTKPHQTPIHCQKRDKVVIDNVSKVQKTIGSELEHSALPTAAASVLTPACDQLRSMASFVATNHANMTKSAISTSGTHTKLKAPKIVCSSAEATSGKNRVASGLNCGTQVPLVTAASNCSLDRTFTTVETVTSAMTSNCGNIIKISVPCSISTDVSTIGNTDHQTEVGVTAGNPSAVASLLGGTSAVGSANSKTSPVASVTGDNTAVASAGTTLTVASAASTTSTVASVNSDNSAVACVNKDNSAVASVAGNTLAVAPVTGTTLTVTSVYNNTLNVALLIGSTSAVALPIGSTSAVVLPIRNTSAVALPIGSTSVVVCADSSTVVATSCSTVAMEPVVASGPDLCTVKRVKATSVTSHIAPVTLRALAPKPSTVSYSIAELNFVPAATPEVGSKAASVASTHGPKCSAKTTVINSKIVSTTPLIGITSSLWNTGNGCMVTQATATCITSCITPVASSCATVSLKPIMASKP